MSRILICDDEIKLSRMLVTALRSAGHQANAAATGQEALRMLGEDEYDVLVTDLRLPDLSGLDVLQEVRARHPRVDVIMITAYATTENAVEALRRGAHDYLIKPFSLDELRLRVDRLLSRRELQAEGQRLREQIAAQNGFSNLVGESARMREVFAQLRQVARTEATVLLLGESGTGKTQLARGLHQHSARRDGPLCEVHCAALPENLLESELFGHERGSFTGAVEQRIGHVERAHKGTLFLDEIGEISPAIQVKLLRFIQDRQFFRIGGTQVRAVDTRFVLATNRDLQQAVRDRTFREDFYYRINVFPIHVPSLRERVDDIPLLAQAFLKRRGAEAHLSDEVIEVLQRYPWPGNVRELENVLERALILVLGDADGVIRLRHLSPTLLASPARLSATAVLAAPGFSLDGFERELIREALARSVGNKTEAAKLLGITRRRLYSRLKSMEGEPGGEGPAGETPDPEEPPPDVR